MRVKNNGNFVHFAVERSGYAGTFVVALTYVPRIARVIVEANRAEVDEDLAAYDVATEDDREAWVNEPVERVIPFDSSQEVWLGFPFGERGAVALTANDIVFEALQGISSDECRADFEELINL